MFIRSGIVYGESRVRSSDSGDELFDLELNVRDRRAKHRIQALDMNEFLPLQRFSARFGRCTTEVVSLSPNQGPSRHCSLLAVLSGKSRDSKQKQKQNSTAASEDQSSYPFPELSFSGRLKVKVLTKPSADELGLVLEQLQPDFVYLQRKQLEDRGEVLRLICKL